MGAPRKLTDEELERITREAISALDNHSLFVRTIRPADIYNYAKMKYPLFSRTYAYSNIVKDVLEREYLKKQSDYIELQWSSVKREKDDYISSFDADRFIDSYYGKPKMMREQLRRIGNQINELMAICNKNTSRLAEANRRIEFFCEQEEMASTGLIKENAKLEGKVNELEEENKRLKTQLKTIEDMAANMVLRDTNMAVVKVIDNKQAKVLTYMSNPDMKKQLLEGMRKRETNGEK